MYDFIIVGSGTSGGVLAYYLTQSNAKCLLLEAGRLYRAETFPKTELDYSAQLFWGGGLEFDVYGKMAFLRARCVGGTSIVNQCLLDRFDDIAWNDWKSDSGVSWFSSSAMEPYYQAVEQELSLQYIPESHYNRNTHLFVEGFKKLGYTWAPLRRGQSDCAIDSGNDCIGCLGGCHRDSKQSTLVAFIRRALNAGLTLVSECSVEKLESHAGHVRVLAQHQEKTQIYLGKKVILAGGSFGTNQLLLKSGFQSQLPALGKRFSCHPQYMAFGLFKDPVDAHRGAFQAVKSADPRFRQMGFKLENVFAPPISIAMLYPSVGRTLHQFMQKYRYLACIEVAVRDEPAGQLSTNRAGGLKIQKPLTRRDLQRRDEGLKLVEAMFRAVGAEQVVISPFYFGLHLMGGCSIGTDPKTAVVNEHFQLHTHPQIYIADSSIFPNAPGINPALTIMSLSKKLSDSLSS